MRSHLPKAVAVCVLIICGAAQAGCGHVAPMPHLPVTWTAISGGSSSVTLNADGTGRFVDVPHGVGEPCLAGERTRLDGEFRWDRVAPGRFRAAIDGDEVVFGADTEVMGDLNWEKLVVEVCEGVSGDQRPTLALGAILPR